VLGAAGFIDGGLTFVRSSGVGRLLLGRGRRIVVIFPLAARLRPRLQLRPVLAPVDETAGGLADAERRFAGRRGGDSNRNSFAAADGGLVGQVHGFFSGWMDLQTATPGGAGGFRPKRSGQERFALRGSWPTQASLRFWLISLSG
jgi:hypothetical protein